MPIASPFHERTAALCTSLLWKDWAGFHAVCSFDICHEREYFAIRHSAGLLDVTPLFKYEVRGPDASAFLTRVMVRDISRLKPGRVTYSCWCDDDGKMLDDGTVQRLDEDHYRVTSAEPTWRWFMHNTRGFDVTIEDITENIAGLALQGPTSREILRHCTDLDMDRFRYFRVKRGRIAGVDVHVSRTGYTGDLGFEVWCRNDDALAVWDAVVEAGQPHGLTPIGLDALDVARVEAGYILAGVDYYAADQCTIEARKSTPYELDLGWTVDLVRPPFIGQAALRSELARGPAYAFVGLEIDWLELERLYGAHDLPPDLPSHAWRTPTPVYHGNGQQVGRATSGTWSPTLKKNLALASVEAAYAAVGTELRIEQTVEYVRHAVTATVVDKPFFDPKRKRA